MVCLGQKTQQGMPLLFSRCKIGPVMPGYIKYDHWRSTGENILTISYWMEPVHLSRRIEEDFNTFQMALVLWKSTQQISRYVWTIENAVLNFQVKYNYCQKIKLIMLYI